MGARGDGRQFHRGADLPRSRLQRVAARRRGDPLPGQVPPLRTRHARGAPSSDAGPTGRPDRPDAPPPRLHRRGDDGGDPAGRRVARHRDRAGLLDGAGPVGRRGRRGLPAGRGHSGRRGRADNHRGRTGRAGGRDALPGSMGFGRAVTGPDAPGPRIPERDRRIDGHRTAAAGRLRRRQPGVLELRDVSVGVRAGRPVGRGPGGPAVARAAGVPLSLVAAGDAVPLEHEVSAAVGAALRLLSGCAAGPAGRCRLGDRRGIPGAAVLASSQAAHRPVLGRAA